MITHSLSGPLYSVVFVLVGVYQFSEVSSVIKSQIVMEKYTKQLLTYIYNTNIIINANGLHLKHIVSGSK